MANEVYLNFESSTPCLADKNFNYTSLISFHCKRGVSMVSVPLGTAGLRCAAEAELEPARPVSEPGAELSASLGPHGRLASTCLIQWMTPACTGPPEFQGRLHTGLLWPNNTHSPGSGWCSALPGSA